LRLVTILPRTTRAYDRYFYPALEREGVEIIDRVLSSPSFGEHHLG